MILGGIALAAFLVYHFAVHVIRNPRQLGGANVAVSRATGIQSQAAIAIDPHNPRVLLAASNDNSLETLRIYDSTDGGVTWARHRGPVVPGGSCAHGEPRVAIDGAGRQYLAFLAGTFCGDNLTPYLVVGERDSARTRWTFARVTQPAWKYGYDDGPALAVDRRTGAVYAAWDRSTSRTHASIVVSRSTDHARTWSAPVEVSSTLVRPHLASIALAPDGEVVVAGIDAKLGVWVARSRDGGRSFEAPVRAAPLVQNPAGSCALAADSPVPREQRTCIGPDPTVVVHGDAVAVVYGDGGADGRGDVFVSMLDRALEPRFRVQVNPPDTGGGTAQFMPTATVDPETGVFWACWYDTTFDPHAHRAWFTCSASRTGRTWSPPERASSVPTGPGDLLADAIRTGFYPAIAAAHGTAHPLWIDGRRPELAEELYTASLPQARAFAAPRR